MPNDSTANNGAPNSQADVTKTTDATQTPDAKAPDAKAPDQQQPNTDDKKPDADGKQPDADGKKPDGTKEGKDDKVIPFTAADITLPEGVARDDESLGELTAFATKHNLSKEAVQDLANLGAKAAGKVAGQPKAIVDAARVEWRKELAADKELGGAKLDENLSVAKKALDAFGSPALKELLEASGLGDHPEIIRAFHKAGSLISEDKLVTSGNNNAAERDPATTLFPNQGKKTA